MDGVPRVPGELFGALHAAFTSEVRLELLLLLEQQSWTSVDLAGRVGRSRQLVRKHLRELEGAGVIRAVGEEPRRGGAVSRYRAVHVGWADLIAAAGAMADAGVEDPPV